jgi:hypothetical protein
MEDPPQDTSLFILPFYELDLSQEDAEGRFRVAYCRARHTADTEDYTTIFNTGVGPDNRYTTREEFDSGEHFNVHLDKVADAFSNAKGVSYPTGFCALGTEDDLDAIQTNVDHNDIATFVKDERSFKRYNFKTEHYFSLDFFMTLKRSDLDFFKEKWGETRDFAATKPYILALAMGVIRDTSHHFDPSGENVTVHLQETYESAEFYKEWLPEASPYADAFFSVGEMTSGPFLNAFTMFGKPDQLALVKEHCEELGCIQYAFDDCEDVESREILV